MSRRIRAAAISSAVTLVLLAQAGPAGAIGEPVNTSVPVVSGATVDGALLSASRGAWSSLVQITGYSYRWIRCKPGCAEVAGATAATYRLTAADYGALIQVRVGATNLLGTGYAYSAKVGPVQAVPPEFPPGGRPTVSGTTREGDVLLGSDGFWTGTPPISVSARGWVRCDINGDACSEPVANGDSYRLTKDDVGGTMRYRVDIQGPQHSATAYSSQTDVVRANPTDPANPGGGGGGGSDSPARPGGARLLKPFPTVLLAGHAMPAGADVTTFVVHGPNGAKVSVRCRGRGCPVRKLSRKIKAGKARLHPLETNLRAGTVIIVRVTQPDRIGKYTRIAIRRAKPPARRDRCLQPDASKPSRCPRGVA